VLLTVVVLSLLPIVFRSETDYIKGYESAAIEQFEVKLIPRSGTSRSDVEKIYGKPRVIGVVKGAPSLWHELWFGNHSKLWMYQPIPSLGLEIFYHSDRVCQSWFSHRKSVHNIIWLVASEWEGLDEKEKLRRLKLFYQSKKPLPWESMK